MEVQQCLHQGQTSVESNLHHPQRTIWTHHHVLQPQQLSCHVPAFHEWLLPRHDYRRMAGHLHERPSHILPWWNHLHPKNSPSATADEGTRPPPETGKMPVHLLRGGISWYDSQIWATYHGPSQTWWNHQLAHSYQSQGGMIFLGLCQLLLPLHSGLLNCGPSPPWPHQERLSMRLDNWSTNILQQLEMTIPIKTSPPTSWLRQIIHYHHWCLEICLRGYPSPN